MTQREPMEVWIVDDTGFLKQGEVLHADAGALGGAVEALSSVAFPLSLAEATTVREEEAASSFNRLAHEVVRGSFAVELAVARAEGRLEPAWLVSAAPVTPRPPPWEDELTPALARQGHPPEVFPQVAPAPLEVAAGLRECVALLGAAGRNEHLQRLTKDYAEERLRALLVYVRAPDHVEHRFRGKWNTVSGASGTPIPAMWNTDSGQVERTRKVGRGMGDTVER